LNIQSVIESIHAQWAANLAETPLYFQVATEGVQVPYCVVNAGTITPADPTISDFDYEIGITFICYSSSDTECLSRMDRIAAAFDRTAFGVVYSSVMTSASLDINFTDPGALWSSEMSFSIRWNR
jgi:hypothetical protein